MKLYDLQNGCLKFRVMEEGKSPPEAPQINEGEELTFHHLDGMYSYCTKDNGDVVHLAAWTEIELI